MQLTATRALLLAATAVAYAEAQALSCHADILLSNVREADLSNEEVQSICRAAAQKIAAEVGNAPEDVLAHVFRGDYNAPWSPSKNRPPADLFLATIINNCKSVQVVLDIFLGPQLAKDLLADLEAVLGNSPARMGELAISGTAVVPAAASASAGALPQLPPTQDRGVSSSSSPPFGWMFAGLAVFVGLGAVAPTIVKKVKAKRALTLREDSEDDLLPDVRLYTGH